MKRTKLDYFNCFLVAIFGVLVIMYCVKLIMNKEFEKVKWYSDIEIFADFHSIKKLNTINIIEAELYNSYNKSGHFLETVNRPSDSVTSPNDNYALKFNDANDLLPDSLNLKYFSFDERKFYLLNAKFSYSKVRELAKKASFVPRFFVEIHPKGKVILNLNVEDSTRLIIDTFFAKETSGNLDKLIFEKNLDGEKRAKYTGIENITDFLDLFEKDFLVKAQAEIVEQGTLIELDAKDFSEGNVNFIEDDGSPEPQSIPNRFYMRWSTQQEHGIQEYGVEYYFNPYETLQAFRKLSIDNKSEPIIISFKLYQKKYPECTVSKGDKVIRLKNEIPENPMEYSN